MSSILRDGPGLWRGKHLSAKRANKNAMLKQAFIEDIEYLCDNFFCDYCKTHFIAYLAVNHPSKYLLLEDGMFKWSVDFHNSVNERLGKPILTYEQAERALYDTKCDDCGLNVTDLLLGSNTAPASENIVVHMTASTPALSNLLTGTNPLVQIHRH